MAAPGTEAAAGPGPGPGQVSSSNGAAGTGAAPESPQGQQQQPAPNAWQVVKGVLFRIFIIWAISSWFRRAPAPQEPNGGGGSGRSPSRNLFPKDTLMVSRDWDWD
ncbi:cleft lip and palate transmembrane protein 1 homolog [Passer montanus]|uniref:cleft lip and palate transmembrane protein 1 homolog n=1 Tax=Passer montanus TaxID=9160 RepID=UPI00195F5D5C|nr:cleft lip and palate transmembrane protein 1 homolog [Passer montanus]